MDTCQERERKVGRCSDLSRIFVLSMVGKTLVSLVSRIRPQSTPVWLQRPRQGRCWQGRELVGSLKATGHGLMLSLVRWYLEGRAVASWGLGHCSSVSHIDYVLSCLVLRTKETKAPARKELGCGLSVPLMLGLSSGGPICLSWNPSHEVPYRRNGRLSSSVPTAWAPSNMHPRSPSS